MSKSAAPEHTEGRHCDRPAAPYHSQPSPSRGLQAFARSPSSVAHSGIAWSGMMAPHEPSGYFLTSFRLMRSLRSRSAAIALSTCSLRAFSRASSASSSARFAWCSASEASFASFSALTSAGGLRR